VRFGAGWSASGGARVTLRFWLPLTPGARSEAWRGYFRASPAEGRRFLDPTAPRVGDDAFP
jgi:hypothetical protein